MALSRVHAFVFHKLFEVVSTFSLEICIDHSLFIKQGRKCLVGMVFYVDLILAGDKDLEILETKQYLQ